ncbi:MAG: hypothetical protein H0U73_04560 [Tatlockia sp.]|nr:hypothetical protein [Tatlockia sp.]
MTEVLQHLQSVIGAPLSREGEKSFYKLGIELANEPGEYFHSFTTKLPFLNILYNVMCARIAYEFARKKNATDSFTNEESESLYRLLLDALSMSELLINIYNKCINVDRELKRLKSEQEVYLTLLNEDMEFPDNPNANNIQVSPSFPLNVEFTATLLNFSEKIGLSSLLKDFSEKLGLSTALINFSQTVRSNTIKSNWPRLFSVRIRRVLNTLLPVATTNPHVAPIIGYLGWLIFLPRLLMNFYLFFKSLFPGWWMSEEEKELGWWLRLQKQMELRGFELFFDAAWVSIGGIFAALFYIKGYAKILSVIDPFIAPVLNHLAWLFYFPRLAVNLFLLFKHVLPGWWMSDEEKKVNWMLRLQAQLQRRWFELFNDGAWFITGLLGSFLLTGGLAPIGMYLTISLFFYDVILAGIRAHIELGRLNNLRAEYQKIAEGLRSSKDITLEGPLEVTEYQNYLEQCISYEQKKLWLSVVSTTALFLGMLFAIPAITNPVVPLIGAILVVTITYATYKAVQWVEEQKPATQVVGTISEDTKERFGKSRYSLFHSNKDLSVPQIANPKPIRSASMGAIPQTKSPSMDYEEQPRREFVGGL